MTSPSERHFAHVFVIATTAWVLCFLAPAPVDAQQLEWHEDWQRFGVAHGVATGVAGAGALSTELFWEEPATPNWIGPILLDDATRTLLLANTEHGREAAARVSDGLVGAFMVVPLLVDPAVAWFGRDSPDVAGQMALIGVESFAVSFLSVTILKRVVARQRPPLGPCYDDPNANDTCDERPNVSFPSGHSATAWTGAGLVCVMHEQLDLYGQGIANRLPCYVAIAGATTTATMRIVSNEHYLADTIVGSLIGFGSGYVLPKLLHFGFGSDQAEPSTDQSRGQLVPITSPDMMGLSYTLQF